MAFFGLTQLGEQRPFHANTSNGLDLTLFVRHDFEVAFDRTLGIDSKEICMSESLDKYMKKLYEGPMTGSQDKGLIELLMEKHEYGDVISREEFIHILLNVQQIQSDPAFWKQQGYKATEHNSSQTFTENNKRGVRLQYGPKDKFLSPLTASQEVGWNIGATDFAKLDKECTKRYPKTSSEVSRYAEAAFHNEA